MKHLGAIKQVVPIILLVFSAGAVGYLVGTVEDPVPETPDIPSEETQVTCYIWAENDTANALCPEKVYAPNSVVNISVKPCHEYEYKIDEERPCNREVTSGTVNLSGLPADT